MEETAKSKDKYTYKTHTLRIFDQVAVPQVQQAIEAWILMVVDGHSEPAAKGVSGLFLIGISKRWMIGKGGLFTSAIGGTTPRIPVKAL